MKTLTKISTTALMGLLAVALSSSAIAGKGGGKGKFGSINHYNDCSIDEDLQALVVKTTISDDSDDTPGIVAELGNLSVDASQKGKGPWQPFGPTMTQSADFGPNYTTIPLCGDPSIGDKTHTMNADISIEVLNAGPGKSYSGSCDDNPLTYCEAYNELTETWEIVYCEEEDESIVEIPEGLCD